MHPPSALLLVLVLALCACRDKDVCASHKPNDNPYADHVADGLMDTILAEPERTLPAGFHLGTATAAYQIESGNRTSDWAAWEKLGRIHGGDSADLGPAAEQHITDDVAAMVAMGLDSYRFSIEWGRLFPTREAFAAKTPDAQALAAYKTLLAALRDAGIRPMVTLQHFTLPLWLHAPPYDTFQGVDDEAFVPLISDFAAWAGATFGDDVDFWITVNEPNAVASGGWIEGTFPPGHLLDLDGFERVYVRLMEAHAAMYDALQRSDKSDADGDGHATRISFATHNRAWLPLDASKVADVTAARRMRYIANLVPIDAALCGNLDRDFDERLSAGRDRIADSTLRHRLDFIALNFYGTAYVGALDVEPFEGVPVLLNGNSPRVKSDLGWDIAPESLLLVLDELRPYGLPIYISENGVADGADNRRPKFLVDSLATVSSAIARGHDLRGYYHWSLLDNFEWAFGFCPRFGLLGVDFQTTGRPRVQRTSTEVMRTIASARSVPMALRTAYTYGAPTPCP